MQTVRFDFVEPTTLDEAVALMAEHGHEAAAVAGGTDLLRDIRTGKRQPALVISLARLHTLSGVRPNDDGGLTVGPLTTMAELARSAVVRERAPALAEAAGHVGSPQVRNRATIGGNLCNARPCADTAPPVIVHSATLELTGKGGTREVAAKDFIINPGQTQIETNELLTAIRLPAPGGPAGSAFETLTNRKAVEITITSSTAWLMLDGDRVAQARICLGSVGPTPLPGLHGEGLLRGADPTPDKLAEAAKACVADASSIDDFRGSADFRNHLVEVLTRRALTRALAWALTRGRGGLS